MIRTVISVILMLTVAPLVACSTLVCLEPSRSGGSINPIAIVVTALFGLITVPLWLTYIPALVLTPMLMARVARTQRFRTMRLSVLVVLSLVVGAMAGALVLSPLVLMSLISREPMLAISWATAGTSAGSITLCLICLIYRRDVLMGEVGQHD